MDATQAQQMIDLLQQQATLLQQVHDDLTRCVWLGTAGVLGIGLVWGCFQFRLWLLSKNQRHFW
jgi:hypothetical protein